MSAASRFPTSVPVSMDSNSARTSSPVSTGVSPFFNTYFGPRTPAAGFTGMTWPVTR
jgi:hypothetical protein